MQNYNREYERFSGIITIPSTLFPSVKFSSHDISRWIRLPSCNPVCYAYFSWIMYLVMFHFISRSIAFSSLARCSISFLYQLCVKGLIPMGPFSFVLLESCSKVQNSLCVSPWCIHSIPMVLLNLSFTLEFFNLTASISLSFLWVRVLPSSFGHIGNQMYDMNKSLATEIWTRVYENSRQENLIGIYCSSKKKRKMAEWKQ